MEMIQSIGCPYCGHVQSIDLLDEDVANRYSYDDRGMGTEIVYEANEDNEIVCEECGEVFFITGYIREYPIGCLDEDTIQSVKKEEED